MWRTAASGQPVINPQLRNDTAAAELLAQGPPGYKPTVLVIITGGTIAMVNEGFANSLSPSSITEFLKELPELRNAAVPNYDILEWPVLLDSSDVSVDEWKRMCDQVQQYYSSYDGFVIAHGTDTMAYTASALAFMLENLNKPVVLTGAMLPIHHIRTDGRRNLTVAMLVAGYSGISEVCLLLGSRLLRGCRARKIDCSDIDSFDSPNFPPLGHIGVDIMLDEKLLLTPSKRSFRTFTNFCRNIIVLKLTAGLPPSLLRQIFETTTRPLGVILELYGSGTAPRGHPEFLEAIKKGIEQGVEIAAVTQCNKGFCCLELYENGIFLYHMGIIECKDMTPEAAFAKMAYLMGKGYSGAHLRLLMESDIRGEITSAVSTVQPEREDATVARTPGQAPARSLRCGNVPFASTIRCARQLSAHRGAFEDTAAKFTTSGSTAGSGTDENHQPDQAGSCVTPQAGDRISPTDLNYTSPGKSADEFITTVTGSTHNDTHGRTEQKETEPVVIRGYRDPQAAVLLKGA